MSVEEFKTKYKCPDCGYSLYEPPTEQWNAFTFYCIICNKVYDKFMIERINKRIKMKLKDVKKGTQLVGMKIKIPKKKREECGIPKVWMIISGGWFRGLWLEDGKKDDRIYPLCFEEFKEIEGYEVKCGD